MSAYYILISFGMSVLFSDHLVYAFLCMWYNIENHWTMDMCRWYSEASSVCKWYS
jgi:hypothetical protein